MANDKTDDRKIVATNKKAIYDYFLIEHYEAGISLLGSEVKAIRAGKVNLKDSFVKIINSEAFLLNAHISYLDTTNPHFRPNETRARRLLLHKKQIDKLLGKTSQEGYTIVPVNLYFNTKNKAKLQIAVAQGKHDYDKRETIKKREQDREAREAMKKYV